MKTKFTSEDMKAAFVAGMEFERAREYCIQHPIINTSNHFVSNPKPNFIGFVARLEFKKGFIKK